MNIGGQHEAGVWVFGDLLGAMILRIPKASSERYPVRATRDNGTVTARSDIAVHEQCMYQLVPVLVHVFSARVSVCCLNHIIDTHAHIHTTNAQLGGELCVEF